MNQVLLDQSGAKEIKMLDNERVEQFTEKEVEDFGKYNERIAQLDPQYSELRPRNRKVLLRVFTKDFSNQMDGVLVHSKTDFLPIKSGVNAGIIYDDFPNPYPFTRKAVVIATEVGDLEQGDIVSMVGKPVVGIGKQDNCFVQVQNAFIHPDYEENYNEYPQDSNDEHYGYILVDEQLIDIKF